MVIGEEYALSGRRNLVRVIMVETESEICGRGWVRVRFEEGISAGEEKRVSSKRIVAPWEEREAPRKRRTPKPRREMIRGPWPPEPGKPIFWHKTGEIRWMVEEVDQRNRRATITSSLVGRTQTHTVSWVELQPFAAESEAAAASELDTGGVLPHLELVALESEPGDPPPARERQRLIDVEIGEGFEGIVRRLVFSPEALERYRRRFHKSASARVASRHLERELRQRARPFRLHPGEYLRARVENRFEVILRERPPKEEAIYVSERDLRIPPARRRRPAQATEKRGKRAA